MITNHLRLKTARTCGRFQYRPIDERSASLIFGKEGTLPEPERKRTNTVKTGRFTNWWKLSDPKHPDRDYVGLNRMLNLRQGKYKVDLAPGNYKLMLSVPKELNANFVNNDVLGSVAGAARATVMGTTSSSENLLKKKRSEKNVLEKKASFKRDVRKGYVKEGMGQDWKKKVVKERGLPTNYVEVSTKVVDLLGRPLFEFQDCLDKGVCADALRSFEVLDDALLTITFRSHSFFKRMKIRAVLQREDPDAFEKMLLTSSPHENERSKRAEVGKKLFLKISGDNFTFDGTIIEMLRAFYKQFCPEKIDTIETVLAHFKGRIPTLITTLEAKYDVTITFNETAAAPS